MTNFSLTHPSPVSAQQENHTMDNGTLDSCSSLSYFANDINLVLIFIFTCFACLFGLLGNGAVIWLLGFRMKRNPFTTYILNLAVADFGALISLIHLPIFFMLVSNCISPFVDPSVGMVLFHFMFSISQFLLTIISIDRCVSVLFPIWYRCHRPEQLSTMLCTLIWIFCFLVHGICNTFDILEETPLMFYVCFVDTVICLPLITISSLIMAIRFCFKTQQRQRKKLLMAILLALFFFLLLAFPLNFIYLMHHLIPSGYEYDITPYSPNVEYFCASLNSCVNPLIYFLVGRKKKGLCTENLKLILHRVFKQEEEVYGEELQLSVQTQVSA